jgi:hypothetical protein
LRKSKSRLCSPNGGNIYLQGTIVDELEEWTKSRKASTSGLQRSITDSDSNSRMSINKSKFVPKSPNTMTPRLTSARIQKKKISTKLNEIEEVRDQNAEES